MNRLLILLIVLIAALQTVTARRMYGRTARTACLKYRKVCFKTRRGKKFCSNKCVKRARN
jgi:hypothetical protein